MITFDAVTKRYGDGTVAVDHLDLECATGEITVLVGTSGCGKTTSLRMINRLVDPTSGSVLLDGRDVTGQDPVLLRRGIGYVIQQGGLFPHRSVIDNIATVPRLLGAGKARARQRAAELLELVGLDQALAGRYPFQLSGGQQQRVGVARALAADPPVLLMDEPFSAVDPVVRADLQRELRALQDRLHKTVVFVTHDIDEAVRLGDRIAVLAVGGRLVQFDTPERILASPADAFVEAFLGTDRGIRWLSFFAARNLRLDAPVTVSGSTRSAELRRRAGETGARWVLVVDDGRRPLGWVEVDRLEAGDGPLDLSGLRALGHSFNVETDSLRAALDAAVLSPAGVAVGVGPDGAVVGVADHAEVAEAIRSAGGRA